MKKFKSWRGMFKVILIGASLIFSSLAFSQTTYTVSTTDPAADYDTLPDLQTDINSGTFDGGANINFDRNDTLVGSLTITNHDGVSGTPIKFGTYGTGADPVITNEVTVTDSWSVYSGNIRQVTLSGAPSDIRFLFADGVNQKFGKTPNSGYYKLNTTGSNTTTLVDDDLTQADDYWNGYTITIHTAPWAIEQRSITDYDSATHTMTVSALGYQPGGFSDSLDAGYIFQNHLGTLDEQGEWYYNTGTNVLYFYGDPAGVEFTYAPTGDLITLSGSDYITFENITFRDSDGYGITGSNSDYTIIDSCSFYYLNSGVYSVNSDYDTLKNSYFEDIATNGVEFVRDYYGDISYNEFNRVANVFGEGDDADGGDDMKAIHLNAIYQNDRYEGCDSVRVFANKIDSVGHSGIHFQMSDNSLIDANYITEYCQLKFDAGGIYAWHNADSAHIPGEVNYVLDYDSSFVTRNYLELNYDILDKTWMTSQVGDDTIAPVYAIYIDDGNMNFRLDSNVMIGANYNMFLHNTGHSYIRNNITYKSRVYGFFVRNNLDANKDTLTDSYIQDNIWVEYWDGSEEIYKHNEYLLYVDPSYNNTWSGNYNMFPFGKLYGSTDIVSGYDDTRGSFSYNVTEWNALSDVSNEDIHPFSYSDTDLSDRDSLVFIAYNFSEDSISTNTLFQDGYGYFDVDSVRQQEDTLAPYESKVYLVDQGAYTYGGVTIIVTLNGTNITCNGDDDGSITANASGGTAPYTYEWTGPNEYSSSSQNISNLEPGLYTCVATDDNLETGEDDITLTEPAVLLAGNTIDSIVTCYGGSDGGATINASGGTPSYLYDWPTGADTQSRTDLEASSYIVTVTDDNGCTDTTLVTMTQNTDISISGVVTNVSAVGETDGAINVTVSGGVGPYTYLWSPDSETTEDISSKSIGTYAITVTDDESCEKLSEDFIISNPSTIRVYILFAY